MLLHRMVWESKHHGYINAYEIGLMITPQYGKSCFDHYAAYQKVYAGVWKSTQGIAQSLLITFTICTNNFKHPET